MYIVLGTEITWILDIHSVINYDKKKLVFIVTNKVELFY